MSGTTTLVKVCATRAALKNQPKQLMVNNLYFFAREDGFAITDGDNRIIIDSMVTAPVITRHPVYTSDYTIGGYGVSSIDTKLEQLGYRSHLQWDIERTERKMVVDPVTKAVSFTSVAPTPDFVAYLNTFCVTPDQFTRYATSMGTEIESTSVDDFLESKEGKIAANLWQKQDVAVVNGESYKDWLNEKYFGADCLAPAESPKAIKNIEFMAFKHEAIQVGMVMEWHGGKYNLPVPDGYWLCDGSTINDPQSPLNGQSTVDKRGRVSAMADAANALWSTRGVESFNLSQSQLPRVNIGSSGNYTPSGSVTVGMAYPMGNNPPPTSTEGWGTYDFASIAGTGRFFPTTMRRESIQNGNPAHDHTASFSGNSTTVSVSGSLNPSASQSALSVMQPTLYVQYIMRVR